MTRIGFELNCGPKPIHDGLDLNLDLCEMKGHDNHAQTTNGTILRPERWDPFVRRNPEPTWFFI